MNTDHYKSRVKRLGTVSMGIALLIFLYYAYSIITTITVLVKGGMAAGNLYGWLSAALMTAAGIVILVLALRIVWSLRGAESPFTLQNAKALRVIGWLLIGYEGVMALLSRHHGSREKAAAELGISKTTLWRRMRKYGISKDLTME